MKRIVHLYPSAWRRRYGAELSELLEELPSNPSTTLDLLRGAITLHMRALVDRVAPRRVAAGGPPMPSHAFQRHPTATALIAALIAAPTTAFVTLSILAYQLDVPGMQAWLQPFMDGLAQGPRIVDLLLVGAPFLAFLVGALPLIGLRLERVNGELRVTVALRPRPLNLVVLGACLVVAGVLVNYMLAEFLVEAR